MASHTFCKAEKSEKISLKFQGRFTILINTNKTSNCQSTNETHYTQQNTTINTHKGSQLLILTETRYQLQPSDKQLHTEHTPLRTIIPH